MVKGTLNLRTAFYLATIRKKFVRWGFLNFVPKIELGDLKFWEAKITLSPISPPILYSGIGKFLDPWGFRRHIVILNFKTLTLKTQRREKFKKSRFLTIGGYFKRVHRKEF